MKIFLRNIFFFCSFYLLLFSCKSPQEKQDIIIAKIPDPKTLNETFVSDPDHILKPSTVNALNTTLKELDISKKAHIDVVVVNSIGNEVPKDIAYKLFNKWKIGRADTNNGLLIFLVLDQRRVEFETGLGLESVLTDMVCGSIQRKYMIPSLKEKNYDQAVLSAISQIIEVLDTGNYSFNDENTSVDESSSEYNLNNSARTDNHSSNSQINALIKLPKEHNYSFIDFISNNSSFLSKFIPVLLVIFFIFSSIKNSKSCLGNSFLLVGITLAFFTTFIAVCYIFLAQYNQIELVYFFLILYFITALLLHIKYIKIFYSIPKQDRYQNYYYLDKYRRGLKLCVWFFPISFFYFLYKKLCNDMKNYRYTPYICKKCHKPMVLEKEKNLSDGQMEEKELKSVEYDVWLCKSCNKETEIKYPNKRSKIKECKKCHFITSKFKENKIEKNATTSKSGWGYKIYVCEFCHNTDKIKYIIPRESSSSSSSSSSGRSGGGSSFSSSSGGRSGGGGAGSSW